MRRAASVALAFVLALTACGPDAFTCATDDQCVRGDGVAGRCDHGCFCSFPAVECPSGWRYGNFSGNALDDQCVTPGGDRCATSPGPPATCSAGACSCAPGQSSCAGSCSDGCTASCSATCDYTIGASSTATCAGGTECTFTVGAGSQVNCNGGARCHVRCDAACTLRCFSATCDLQCASDSVGRSVSGQVQCP